MKKYLIIILLSSNFVFCQFPKIDFKNTESPQYNQQRNGLNIGLSYITTTFVNPVFKNNLDASNYKRSLGVNFRIAYIYKALIIDVNGFYSGFDKDNTVPSNLPNTLSMDTLMYKHQGYDVNVSYNLMVTKNNWLRKHITPYIGIGYQFSALALTNKKLIIGPKSYSTYSLNSPMWKVGVILNIHKYFNLFGEFKQSLTFESDDPNRLFQINAGLSFKYSR